jgi:predicted secreted protein
MLSIDAGTPPAGDGRPPAESTARRGLRDRPLGRILLLALVLVAALVVARTCGSQGEQVSREEAIEIAKREAAFTPCAERGCVIVRAVNRGIPTRLVWIVGLAESLDEDGRPVRFANFLVDARTGEIARS